MSGARWNANGVRRAAAGLTALLALGFYPRLAHAQMSFARLILPSDSAGVHRLTVKPKSIIKAADSAAVTAKSNAIDSAAAPAKSDSKPADSAAVKHRRFTAAQMHNDRVLAAVAEKRFELKQLFRERGLTYPAAETFFRIFKRELLLEVWVRTADRNEFTLLKSYPICALAGQLGPKRAEGDGQTPEGFYTIDDFNPQSDYHLSLHLDYPNRSDQLLNADHAPGGKIYIHGGCKTEGCLAVTDDAIKELYWLGVEARNAGQQKIPVHIFPAKLTDDELFRLMQLFDKQPDLKRFWANLKPTYDYFETSHKLPVVTVDAKGRYHMRPAELLGVPVAPPVADTSKGGTSAH